MLRSAFALCALTLLSVPQNALSRQVIPDDFERPDVHRHAINAFLGDLSFILRYGEPPAPGTDPDLRVRTHLEFVHAFLSQRDVSDFPPELREARRRNLANLKAYIDAGRFPRNYLYADENRPCFIDRDGRICAAGYLVERTAGREVAERVNDAFQSEFLWKMHLPELDRWVADSGLSLLELCMIQPCYVPYWGYVQITQDSDRVPATVSIEGYVYDVSFCCLTKYVIFDFGDGALWSSPIVNSDIVLLSDIAHIYVRPGVYTITGIAIAEDGCGNQSESNTWEVSFTQPAFVLEAVQAAHGDQYDVYLRTSDDIRMDYLTGATVDWDDGTVPGTIGWSADGSSYRTPAHTYPSSGYHRIVVTNRYDGDEDTYSETSWVDVAVGSVAVQTSSWGRIKAMFVAER